jgi:hypothetical protein
MTNNKQQTAVDWLIEQLIEHRIIIVDKTTYQVKYKHEILLEQAKEMYHDEIEAAIIKQCAEESTSKASSYTEGYTEGYKRAVDYMTDTLKNKIKIKENGTNSTSVGRTLGTTSITRLCTVFIPNKFVFKDRCKNCGNQQHQHVITTNTI